METNLTFTSYTFRFFYLTKYGTVFIHLCLFCYSNVINLHDFPGKSSALSTLSFAPFTQTKQQHNEKHKSAVTDKNTLNKMHPHKKEIFENATEAFLLRLYV